MVSEPTRAMERLGTRSTGIADLHTPQRGSLELLNDAQRYRL